MKQAFKSRKLTVTYEMQQRPPWSSRMEVPKIRIAGLWLCEAGFTVGHKVEVKVFANRIIICKMKQPRNS